MKLIFVCLALAAATNAYIENPGPKIPPTIGEIWPKPQMQQKFDGMYSIDLRQFYFEVVGHTCHILEDAIIRYRTILSYIPTSPLRLQFPQRLNTTTNIIPPKPLNSIAVNLSSPCEKSPHLHMDESYTLDTSTREISANSIWGILRGLESFSQLATPFRHNLLILPNTRVEDFPRFAYRGLLVDTARHFFKMETLYKILDGMSYNKLNVFHWHIVDDQTFPYESMRFPELAQKGSYGPGMTYSQQDVADIIEYARMRGIRVIPEFDVPGHTRSWGNSHPEILTECGGKYEGKLGPIDPINEKSYSFLRTLFDEVLSVFEDRYMHLGGDEVGFECWQSNADLVDYIKRNNLTFTQLQKNFMEKVTRIVTSHSRSPIVWQEAMVANVDMPKDTVVQIWTGNWRKLIATFTKQNLPVLMSQCWYLDHLSTGGDWRKFYLCEPQDFDGTPEQMELVKGGEACMWSEVVNDFNVVQRIFPRVSAAAERLWSPRNTTDVNSAAERIEEHTCRLLNRGIAAQPPNGAGFC